MQELLEMEYEGLVIPFMGEGGMLFTTNGIVKMALGMSSYAFRNARTAYGVARYLTWVDACYAHSFFFEYEEEFQLKAKRSNTCLWPGYAVLHLARSRPNKHFAESFAYFYRAHESVYALGEDVQ